MARHKGTDYVYALKQLQKQSVVKDKHAKYCISEKRILSLLNHPFVLRSYTTFQDTDSLYMLTELIDGCELFELVFPTTSWGKKGRAEETVAVLRDDFQSSNGSPFTRQCARTPLQEGAGAAGQRQSEIKRSSKKSKSHSFGSRASFRRSSRPKFVRRMGIGDNQARWILAALLDALEHVHSLSIRHRDLKVLFGWGRVKPNYSSSCHPPPTTRT